VLVEEQLRVVRELYVGLVVDGGAEGVVVMASEAGGMDIEEVAEATPERVLRLSVDPMLGLQPFQGRAVAYGLDVKPAHVRSVADMVSRLYSVFEGNDCSLVEINPLVEAEDGRVLAADAKLSFEDDALFRHPELQKLNDPEQEDPFEARARDIGVNYVKLDGEVGCLVNGAGLAMATMDVAGAAGAAPANFLDVGGSADEEKVAQALRIILSDPSVTKVLVNIFGGILRCDVVARGILAAAGGMPDSMPPIVARLRGTNVEEGRKILAGSRLDVTLVDNLAEAADAIKKAGTHG
jgi:succinyl-CoA synthetase beta subunit